MGDERLRELERRWQESGTKEDRKAYERERIRAGLGRLPRERIVHYVTEDRHGLVGPGGTILLSKKDVGKEDRVLSQCGNELWPRNLRHEYYPSFRKNIYYTEDPDDVTCKSCRRSMDKPAERVRYRTHYAPGSKDGRKRGITPVPVCGRNDSDRFTETHSWRMAEVNCPACRRIMKMGRRASRKPRGVFV